MDRELGTFSVDAYASKQKVIAQALQNDILTGRLGRGPS